MNTLLVTPLYTPAHNIWGITLDDNDNIYFTSKNSWVMMIPKGSNEPKILIEDQSASFRGITWHREKNTLYICRWEQYDWTSEFNKTIVSYDLNTGTKGRKIFENVNIESPLGMAMNANDNLYITDQHLLRKINLQTEQVETMTISERYTVAGLAIDKDGTIYVACNGGHCIYMVQNGKVSILSGKSHECGFEDGTLDTASLIHSGKEGSLCVRMNTGASASEPWIWPQAKLPQPLLRLGRLGLSQYPPAGCCIWGLHMACLKLKECGKQ